MPTPFEVQADGGRRTLRIVAPATGTLELRVVDQAARPMPARVAVVGTHPLGENPSDPKRRWLYDLRAGQQWLTSDMEPDTDDSSTRRYIEAMEYLGADGTTRFRVRPGTYELVFSRGPEYEAKRIRVELGPGQVRQAQAVLRRVLRTPGWVSGDFHLHAQGSIDSGLDYNVRVLSVAAEGLESAVSTDHNFISDYRPYVVANGLEPFLSSHVGLELTTFEAGHFNGFPLRYDTDHPQPRLVQVAEHPA